MAQSNGENIFVDLQAIARNKTERKEPGLNGNGNGHSNGSTNGTTWSPAQEPAAAPKQDSPPAQAQQQPASSSSSQPPAEQEPPERVYTAEEIQKAKATGKVGAYLTGGLVEMIFGLTSTGVYISQFKADEKQILIALDDKPETDWTEPERSLNMKFLDKQKKYEARKKKIPLDDREIKILEEAFADYRKVTGKDLNPQLILWSAITRIFVSRGMEILF